MAVSNPNSIPIPIPYPNPIPNPNSTPIPNPNPGIKAISQLKPTECKCLENLFFEEEEFEKDSHDRGPVMTLLNLILAISGTYYLDHGRRRPEILGRAHEFFARIPKLARMPKFARM